MNNTGLVSWEDLCNSQENDVRSWDHLKLTYNFGKRDRDTMALLSDKVREGWPTTMF